MNRPLCTACHGNPAAINYYSGDKIRYRKVCASCARKGKRGKEIPAWVKAGYKKKLICERCNFKGKLVSQLFVFHIDGNLNNSRPANLKTVCANCQRVLHKEGTQWRQGDLLPDF